jgi:Carbohydrate-binding module 48 (Isoamylase N-terminal domain)
MTESDQHPYVEWIAREAQRPVVTDLAARERIMMAVRTEPLPQRRSRVWQRVFEPRAFRLSPIASALLAAGLVGFGLITGKVVNNRGVHPSDGGPKVPAVVQQPSVSDTVVKFVFVAPQASKVSVVGDFNGWDTTTTPMVRTPNSSLWTVTLPLTTGRHVYSFLVDGSTWNADPAAPLAPDDGFGPKSVRIVGRGSAL